MERRTPKPAPTPAAVRTSGASRPDIHVVPNEPANSHDERVSEGRDWAPAFRPAPENALAPVAISAASANDRGFAVLSIVSKLAPSDVNKGTMMTMRKYGPAGRLKQLLFLLACIQVFAPATAAIAEGLRVDQRQPVAHIESERGAGCVLVHSHDCVLCSIATGPMARPESGSSVEVECQCPELPTGENDVSRHQLARPHAPSRAPPFLQT